jgi:hypothetical protein
MNIFRVPKQAQEEVAKLEKANFELTATLSALSNSLAMIEFTPSQFVLVSSAFGFFLY